MSSVPLVPASPDSNVFGKGYDSIVKAARAVIKGSKPPLTLKTAHLYVGSDCWADVNITLSAVDICAIGVVEPGGAVTSPTAATSRGPDSKIGIGCAFFAALVIVVLMVVMGRWSTSFAVISFSVVGVCLATYVWITRQNRVARKHSRLVPASEDNFALMKLGMCRLGQINTALDDFDKRMRHSSQRAGIEPLSLPDSIKSAPKGIHVTLWELANRGGELNRDSLAKGIEEVTKAVFGTIQTNWAAFEGFTVPIPEAPTALSEAEPKRPAVDAVRLLKDITEQIETDRAAAEQTNLDIARINRPEDGFSLDN